MAPPRNGLGTAGFVVGLIGFLLSLIPFVGVVAWPLVIVGLILSIVGLLRVKKRVANNKGLAIAGIVLSALGLIACILYTVVTAVVVSDAVGKTVSFPAKSGDAHTVEFSVTSATGSSVTYGGGLTLKQGQSQSGAGFSEKGSFGTNELDLHLMAIPSGAEAADSVACKIVVDGKTVAENQSPGAATCEFNFKG